jgi:hypothetical protein
VTEVEGEGVVGEQPTLHPGACTSTAASACSSRRGAHGGALPLRPPRRHAVRRGHPALRPRRRRRRRRPRG